MTKPNYIQSRLLRRKWPEKLDKDDYPELIALIRKGDAATIERVGTSFIPLLGSLVRQHCRRIGTMRHADDMLAAGLLGIWDGLDHIRAGNLTHDNLGGYLVKYIHQHIRKELSNIPQVRVPGSTFRTWQTAGQNTPDRIQIGKLPNDLKIKESPEAVIDLEDFLNVHCYNQQQREIVRMCCDGYTDVEIAGILDIPRPTVQYLRSELAARIGDTLETANVD